MTATTAEPQVVLRPHAEDEHRAELAALATADNRPRPPGWRLSPWAVTTYLLGGQAGGTEIPPPGRGRRGHAGHRPRPAAARRAGHGQDLAV